VYWLLTENYVLNANILVFMLIHTELFSKVSGLGLDLEKNFRPRPRPRPHCCWPRPQPWPHAQLASLTSLGHTKKRKGAKKRNLPTLTLTFSLVSNSYQAIFWANFSNYDTSRGPSTTPDLVVSSSLTSFCSFLPVFNSFSRFFAFYYDRCCSR